MTKKELQKLQKKWYNKLARSGFKDLENVFVPGEPLRHWDSVEFQRYYSPRSFTEKQRYYELAGQLLHDLKFKNNTEKKIWELHSKGESYQEIAKKVNLHNNTVGRIVKKYAGYIKYNSD